jgi:hypothetical protein
LNFAQNHRDLALGHYFVKQANNRDVINEIYRFMNCAAGQFYGVMRDFQTIKLALNVYFQTQVSKNRFGNIYINK